MPNPQFFSGLSYLGPLKEESVRNECKDHPGAKWRHGFGYAGGGYGPYRICDECNSVFAKIDLGDMA